MAYKSVFIVHIIGSIILSPIVNNVSGSRLRVQRITPAGATLLESPQWSVQENALYWVEVFGQTLYRMDGNTGDITSRTVCSGLTSLIVPVRDHPGYVVVATRSTLNLLKWGALDGDRALRQLTMVDRGKPDNNIDDGKADAKGRLWFGTMSKLDLSLPSYVILDQGTMYSMDYNNYAYPCIKKRPISISNGIAWSLDNKKMHYNDSPTRKIVTFDFELKTGSIGNETVLFDFDKHNITGMPDGMTIDQNGNLWVGTVTSTILVVNSKTGELVWHISLPVDQVTSMMWGGRDLSTLFVTTGCMGVTNPMPWSGALLALTGLGTKGLPENQFVFPNAPCY